MGTKKDNKNVNKKIENIIKFLENMEKGKIPDFNKTISDKNRLDNEILNLNLNKVKKKVSKNKKHLSEKIKNLFLKLSIGILIFSFILMSNKNTHKEEKKSFKKNQIFRKRSFTYDKGIKINEIQKTLSIKIKKSFKKKQYYMYSKINKNFKIILKIKSINILLRMLEIGILKESKKKNLTLENFNLFESYSFNGFSKNLLLGKLNVFSYKSDSGFDFGKKYIISFIDGIFRIKSDSDFNIDVYRRLNPLNEYFFYFIIFDKETEFTFENV